MVQSSRKVREEEIGVMMKKVEKASSSSSPLDLSELFVILTSDVTSRLSLGRKHSKEERMSDFNNRMRKFMELINGIPVGEYVPCLALIDKIRGLDDKVEELNKIFGGLMDKVVQEHLDAADKPTLYLVDILLSLERHKISGIQVGRSDINFIILDMLFGGMATTKTLLEWTMTELIRHPACMKKLQDEIRAEATMLNLYRSEAYVEDMKYLKAVIKEVLRLHPPLPLLLPRLLHEDVKINGYDIAAGTQVLINAWAIQRDTVTWGMDAEEFRPERHLDSPLSFRGTDFKYTPFGSGRRICPGIRYGLALAEVTLANLVSRTSRFNWRMDSAEATGIEVSHRFPLIAFPSTA